MESSHAAYLGCLFRHREVLGNDPTNSIKGFKEAHEAIVNMVGEKVIPPVGTFFDKETKGPTSNVENFAGHVQDKIWAKKQLEMDAKATTQEKFVRSCTKAETCTDVFKAQQSPIASTMYPRTCSKWQRKDVPQSCCESCDLWKMQEYRNTNGWTACGLEALQESSE